MQILLKVAIYAAALWVAVQLVGGLEFEGDVIAFIIIAVILAVVNAFLRPIAKILSFPLLILTMGLFILVINAVMLSITIWVSEGFDLGLTSDGFGATFLGAIIISVVTWIAESVTEAG